MSEDTMMVLDEQSIKQRLKTGGTGVLSVAKDDTPYSIPVSFGYDARANRLFLQLGFTPDSEKHRFVSDDADARFVVYEQSQDNWQSIIAIGVLHEITPEEIDNQVVRNLAHAEPPLYSFWEAPVDTVEFRIFELDVTSLSGRLSAI